MMGTFGKAIRKRTLRENAAATQAALDTTVAQLRALRELNAKMVEKLAAMGIQVKVDKMHNITFEPIQKGNV